MPRTSPYSITLADAERAELEARARRHTSPYSELILRPGETFRQLLFELLRPGAEPGELRGPAGRTEGGIGSAFRSGGSGMVVPVQRECDVAARQRTEHTTRTCTRQTHGNC